MPGHLLVAARFSRGRGGQASGRPAGTVDGGRSTAAPLPADGYLENQPGGTLAAPPGARVVARWRYASRIHSRPSSRSRSGVGIPFSSQPAMR